MSSELRRWLTSAIETWDKDVVRALEQDLSNVHGSINGFSDIGDTLTAASTLYVSARIHLVDGTAAIQRIVVPPEPTPAGAPLMFSGAITLIPLAAWTLAVVGAPAGNIARAVTAVVKQAFSVVYVPQAGLWYPATS
jgi:hypothetical protein